MKNATLRQFRVFAEVARHLSFARAAQTLHITPPAVTMLVRELEGQVGLPLFHRSGRHVQLTTVGEYVLVYARRMLATLKDAQDAVARLQKLEMGTLTIGMVSTAKYFLPRLLTEFRAEHPGIEIKLAVGNREQLMLLLHANEVDIAIMGRPTKDLATRTEPFAVHPLVFVCPLDHPITLVVKPSLADLQPYGFIVREQGSGTRAALEQLLTSHKLALNVTMEMASNGTIKQAVMAGMGLGFLSLHTLGLELDNHLLSLVDVQETPVIRAWHSVHPLSKVLSPAAEAFRYFVLERGEAFLAQQFGRHLQLVGARSIGNQADRQQSFRN